MKDYTNTDPAFADKIKIIEETDVTHADIVNEPLKQLLDNDIVLKTLFDLLADKLKDAVPQSQINGFKIYTSPAQFGIDIKSITSLVEIINKMPDYSAFYFLTGDSLDSLYSKKLVPHQYGSLQIIRYNVNRVILEFTGSGSGYQNFYNYTYTAFYHTSQGDVSEWIKTINDKNYRDAIPGVDGLLNLYDSTTRPTSLDINFSDEKHKNKVTYMLATSSAVTGKPPNDALVLNFGWDNQKWGTQLAISNGSGINLYSRGCNGTGVWGDWIQYINTMNYRSLIFNHNTDVEMTQFEYPADGSHIAMQQYNPTTKTTIRFQISESGTVKIFKKVGDGDWTNTGIDFTRLEKHFLPLAGGTITGTLVMQDLTLFDGVHNQKVIQAFDDGDGNANYGCDIVVTGNGNTFIGSGEAPKTLRNALLSAVGTGESYGKVGETCFLTSDTDMYFYSNCQAIANRIGMMWDSAGNLRPLENDTRGLGTSSYRWFKGYFADLFADLLQITNIEPNLSGTGSIGSSAKKFNNVYSEHFHVGAYMKMQNIYMASVSSNYFDVRFKNQPAVGIGYHCYDGNEYMWFLPLKDNRGYLGSSDTRWTLIYCASATITTSDRTQKKEISYLGKDKEYEDTYMSDEIFVEFMRGLLPAIYKLIDGESGRPHHGFIAQDIEKLMQELGIKDHAGFIKSPKTKEVEIETEVEKEVEEEVTNEDGTVETVKKLVKEIQKSIKLEEIPGEYIYSLRYEEFIPDLARYCQILDQTNQKQAEKIEDLETRLAVLENIVKKNSLKEYMQ